MATLKRRQVPRMVPFKQQRAGDSLEPVEEWTRQFAGSVRLNFNMVDHYVDGANTANVPHGLSRPIQGAWLVGVLGDVTVTPANAVAYLVAVDESTPEIFPVAFGSAVTGTFRWLVF